jgi:hypothetical protein
VAQAMAAAWRVFRKAAGDEIAGWDMPAAEAEIRPAGPLTHRVPRVVMRPPARAPRPRTASGRPPPLVSVIVDEGTVRCWPPFFLSVKSAPDVVAGEGHLRRGGTRRATTA